MAESNETYQTLDLSLRVGELLLSSGAGAADVAAQMLNVAYACGLRRVTADVTFTELAMSHQPQYDEPALIQLRQVRHRDIDYGDLTLVDHLIRDVVEGRCTREEASARLARIVSSGHQLPRWAVTLGYGLMGAGVGLMLGGDAVVTLVAFVAAVAIDLTQRQLTRRRLPSFYQQVAGGMLATLIASAVAATGVNANPSQVVTASIILLLSGVNFMGAIQDALIGYPLTAGARILEAILATSGVIAGVSGGLTLARVLNIDFGPLNPGAFSLSDLPLMALGGAISAGAFAFASYAPLRSLLPIAATGAVATALYGLVLERDLGVAWASATGALLVGLVSYSVAGRVRVPALIIVVSAVVPLLPGLSIFRGLAQLAEGSETGLLSMVNAAAVAIALSSGVFLGEYIAQPLKREARRLESRLAGPRMVGPFHTRSARRRRSSSTSQ
ncbi:threonine/serine ThrE exporter family protein [Nocardioides sp.]|uniref:threonine/serine ThrE exporter family protein n=1 Tax=Nocardioides sp. TaxID=35761 RepID=UPI003D14094C